MQPTRPRHRRSIKQRTVSAKHATTKFLSLEKTSKYHERDGIVAVQRVKSVHAWRRNAYAHILTLRWSWVLFTLLVAVFALSLVFAALYAIDSRGLDITDGTNRFAAAYLYALSVTTTVVDSPYPANSHYTVCLSNLQMIISQLLWVFTTGIVFARLSQPMPELSMANTFVTTRLGDYDHLLLRVVLTGEPPTLLSVTFNIEMGLFRVCPVTGPFIMLRMLELSRPFVPRMRFAATLRHIIDESSPLWGVSLDELTAPDSTSFFNVSVFATHPVSMQPVMVTREYAGSDIRVNHHYENMINMSDPRYTKLIDHTLLHSTIPAMPGDDTCGEGPTVVADGDAVEVGHVDEEDPSSAGGAAEPSVHLTQEQQLHAHEEDADTGEWRGRVGRSARVLRAPSSISMLSTHSHNRPLLATTDNVSIAMAEMHDRGRLSYNPRAARPASTTSHMSALNPRATHRPASTASVVSVADNEHGHDIHSHDTGMPVVTTRAVQGNLDDGSAGQVGIYTVNAADLVVSDNTATPSGNASLHVPYAPVGSATPTSSSSVLPSVAHLRSHSSRPTSTMSSQSTVSHHLEITPGSTPQTFRLGDTLITVNPAT